MEVANAPGGDEPDLESAGVHLVEQPGDIVGIVLREDDLAVRAELGLIVALGRLVRECGTGGGHVGNPRAGEPGLHQVIHVSDLLGLGGLEGQLPCRVIGHDTLGDVGVVVGLRRGRDDGGDAENRQERNEGCEDRPA